MGLKYLKIENFKSIKNCNMSIAELNILIGENGAGKTTILDAIKYFYNNMTENNQSNIIFDKNNFFSNCVKITLFFDCSHFFEISKSNMKHKSNYDGYFKKIISLVNKKNNYVLKLELKQIKNKTIQWNYDYQDRLIIKSLFPLFVIDTRNIDILHWEYIWDIIGDFNKLSNHENNKISKEINQILLDDKEDISKKIISLEKIFKQCNINLRKFKPREFSRILTQLFCSGSVFQKSKRNLSFFSDGTNTINYIELFLEVVNELSRQKMKEPIILLDEPEISLHPLFIDQLSNSIIEKKGDFCILLSTHSPRLIKNIQKKTTTNEMSLYNVRLLNKYTKIYIMNLYTMFSPQSKYRVMDDHINSYFSKAILFVEGESELELFSNEYLLALFPKLRFIDVFKGMSDELVLNVMNPNKNKSSIPFLCLVDLDKIIEYDTISRKFRLKQIWNDSKEKYVFHKKEDEKLDIRFVNKRLKNMTQKLVMNYQLPFYSCEQPNFKKYLEVIKYYLSNYHIFTFETTVEGSLINLISIEYFFNYMKRENENSDNYKDFINYIQKFNQNDRLNLTRMLYGGKSDLLKKYKKIDKETLPEQMKNVLEQLSNSKKTNGWITDFIEFYFKSVCSIENIDQFKQYIYRYDNKKEILKRFSIDFKELNRLIIEVCGMIER